MGSLSELLSKEGFAPHHSNSKSSSNKKNGKHNRTVAASDHDSISLPIYICHDRKSFEQPKNKKTASVVSVSSKGRRSSLANEPAIDAVATKAVISILSAYAGKYIKDKDFRNSLREKCCSCLVRKSSGMSDNGIFANMELGIESIEKLIDNPGTVKELRMKSLRNSIGFLTIVASLNSKESRNGTTCGTPNSYLSACAQLYLSIVYKLEKNDRICARHVLQVFVDSPQLARTHLLPDLWDHFFLPHLLHLKIWFNKQVETVSDELSKDQEEHVKHLTKAYEDHMDMGTIQFALYYKEWLKTGGQPPANLPSVPLPSINLSPASSTRRRRSSSFNNFLHRAIFGNPVEKQPSTEFDSVAMEKTEDDYNTNQQSNVESSPTDLRKSSSLNSSGSNYTRFLPCQSLQTEPQVMKSRVVTFTSSSDLTRAISTIISSQTLPECEMAIRVITKAWLDDPSIERTLSKPPLIEGMLEVLFASNNEEILELVISLLTEFVTRNESNGKIILNVDPQLEGFMNLMRNSSLFLKAATLLHLVKPEAKQMISIEWIPLVLRVLEFGDQKQTLFSVCCSPQVAAYYFLDQLLTRFDQDRNLENGRQVISLGGLNLLLRRMEIGDVLEKTRAVSIIYCCILADGRCRHYLANNLNPECILELLVHATEFDCNEIVVSLLVELICLNRFEQRIKLFEKLLKGWDCLNTMQILFVSLQRATREKRPLVAAIMLQLDLMGDPLKNSVYREEAIEAIYEAFDHQTCNENVQEQAAKSLLILGGRYAYNGTLEVEKWILKEAGFDESLEGGFHGRYYVVEGSKRVNKDDEIEHWQRKAAMALWISGRERLIGALGEAIANGIPCLARASLVTVAWMSKFVHTAGDGDIIQSVEFSTLITRLIESLNRDNPIEERVLASFALLALSKSSGFLFEILDDEKKEMVVHLRNISKVTWTAKRLASTIAGSPSRRHTGL